MSSHGHTVHEFGSHLQWHIGGITFHADTLMMTWLSMLILTIVVIYFSKRLIQKPGKAQIVVESTVEFVESLVKGQID